MEKSLGYCSHSPLVTMGDTLSGRILLYCPGTINANENLKKPDNKKGFSVQRRKQSCKNCKKEKS